MKRILLLFLMAVLLAGCTGRTPVQTTAPTEQTQPTQPQIPGIYDPDSALEQQTRSALRVYRPNGQLRDMALMGERLLAVTEGEGDSCLLTLYEGETCVPIGFTYVPGSFRTDSAAVNISDTSISYYDGANREVVLMGADLLEQERVLLPGEAVGEPAVSRSFSTVYYSTGTEIRVLDVQTGITRLLRTMNCDSLTLEQLCFADTVLVCTVSEGEESYTAFLSTQTGETMGLDENFMELTTRGGQYFLQRRNASVTELLYGKYGQNPRTLNPVSRIGRCHAVNRMYAAVTEQPVEKGLDLQLYDLASGMRIAGLTVADVTGIGCVTADVSGSYLWFVAHMAQGESVICRWDTAATPVHNSTDYTSQRYTREAPDAEGIARCQQWADELGSRYGVEIAVAEDKLVMAERYSAVSEYQVAALEQGLKTLESAMERFPEDFFRTMAQVSSDQMLHISLVRSITHNGDGHDVGGLRYWIEGREYIALAIYDGMEQNFYHEICHALDSYVLANSSILDAWEKQNPKDFAYDRNYTDYLQRESHAYLQGDDRAFVDSYSMSYPMEDRARFFEYAMMAGQETLFAPDAMQAKLALLCEAIRDAFGWKEDLRVFPWEQYWNI
ncbi:MAG: hypothetical protein IJB17_04220 [Oscillospiraceae bacterium]|nr:hypothetical protein [Oscillospiraceae bacterium]